MFRFKTIFFIVIFIVIIYLVFFRNIENYIPSIVDGQTIMNISSLYNLKNMVVNNINVSDTVTANDLIIDDNIQMNNFNLSIDASGVLTITDRLGNLMWSSKKLIGSSLYDPTGRYAFYIDYAEGMRSKVDEPVMCTHMYDTNVDGFGLQQPIPNLSQYGGISDASGQYLLSIDSEVWYKTPGIKLQNCFDISFNEWPVVDLGIKQGQLNYDNTFIIPLNFSSDNPNSGLGLYYVGTSSSDPQKLLMSYR